MRRAQTKGNIRRDRKLDKSVSANLCIRATGVSIIYNATFFDLDLFTTLQTHEPFQELARSRSLITYDIIYTPYYGIDKTSPRLVNTLMKFRTNEKKNKEMQTLMSERASRSKLKNEKKIKKKMKNSRSV